MKKRAFFLCAGIIAVCFLYTGSAYMSQFYRLAETFDADAVDLITSGLNYLLQAAGIGVMALWMKKKPAIFENRFFFPGLLASGAVFMALSLWAQAPAAIVLCGAVFNLHIGVYFWFYLTLLARTVPPEHAGVCYGAAYAAGSVGTYLLSLIGEDFLLSEGVVLLYLALATVTAALSLFADRSPADTPAKPVAPPALRFTLPLLALMVLISVVGSGLFYSTPQGETVNWNLIRAFYAAGLIGAGVLFDKSRFVGAVCTAASLTYPLIAVALAGLGAPGTVVLALSYAFRGFVSVYTVLTFTDPGFGEAKYLPLAAVGLMLSRAVEAAVTAVMICCAVPVLWQLVFCAFCFVPLLLLLFFLQSRVSAPAPISAEKRLALFAQRYGLTVREAEILQRLTLGLTDQEIAEQCFVSKSTVRFHISNILKKTGASTRAEAVRALQTY